MIESKKKSHVHAICIAIVEIVNANVTVLPKELEGMLNNFRYQKLLK